MHFLLASLLYLQITFDTPYYPEKTRDRVFDYVEMAMAVDFYFIMAYDVKVYATAWATCPLNSTMWGMYK